MKVIFTLDFAKKLYTLLPHCCKLQPFDLEILTRLLFQYSSVTVTLYDCNDCMKKKLIKEQ